MLSAEISRQLARIVTLINLYALDPTLLATVGINLDEKQWLAIELL